ncbi:phage tail tape measure protein [Superficieibacter electus]
MESYSDAMSSRSSRIEENLGTIERLWNNIKDTASGAWDAMLNIGRQITPAQTLEGLKKQLAEQKSSLASLTAASPNQSDTGYGQQRNRLGAIEQQKKVSATEAQISALEKAIALEGDIAVVREKTATANQEDLDASVRKNTNIERYESNAVKRARELKDLAKDRSKYTAAEYKMVKEGIEKRYADPKTHDKPVKTSAGDRDVDSGSAQTLELEAQLRTLRQHKDINDKISPQRRALWELESKIAVLEKIQLDPRGRALTADEKSLLATKEKARAQAEVNARLGDQVLAQQRLNALADQALKFSQQQAAKRSEISAQAEGLSRREAEREANLQRLRDSYAANPQALRSVLVDQQATYDAEDALRSDWLAGAKQGWAEYKDSATNVFSSVQQVSQSTFSGLANQLTTLTTTGKASFKDFTTSILKMIASVTNQLVVAYTLQSAMGWISGSTQTPATGQSLAVPSFRPPGYDGGGFTGHGGKYDPAGIVHRGEFVFHKEATSRLGVGNLYRLMRGYASGGFVGGSGSPAGASPFGVSVYAPVSVTTQQDDAQPKGNNDQLGRAYQQVIDKAVRDGISRESRPGGILWGITKPR